MMRLRNLGAVASLCLGAGAFGMTRFADFKADLATKVDAANKANATVVTGQDGWLFIVSELRHLSLGTFWGGCGKSGQ